MGSSAGPWAFGSWVRLAAAEREPPYQYRLQNQATNNNNVDTYEVCRAYHGLPRDCTGSGIIPWSRSKCEIPYPVSRETW